MPPLLPLGSFYPRDCSLIGFAMFNATAEEQQRSRRGYQPLEPIGTVEATSSGGSSPGRSRSRPSSFLEENTVGKAGTLIGKAAIAIFLMRIFLFA